MFNLPPPTLYNGAIYALVDATAFKTFPNCIKTPQY